MIVSTVPTVTHRRGLVGRPPRTSVADRGTDGGLLVTERFPRHEGAWRYGAGMAGSVSRLPNGTTGGDERIPPIELYKIAVDEYRFQAQFNWTRTQAMLVFNTALLAAGSAVASGTRSGHGAALIFVLGGVASSLSVLVVRTQHGYYRAARSHMRRLEEASGIAQDLRLDTTATLGGRKQTVTVNQLVYLLLAVLAASHCVGVIVILSR